MRESNDNDYVSLIRIPRKRFRLFAWIFSSFVILNLCVEVFFGWKIESLGETLLTRTSTLMGLIVGGFFIISFALEEIMFEYAKRFKEQVYAEGKAEGKTETLNAFREARRRGIPLEKVLETYDTENANETNDADTANRDS